MPHVTPMTEKEYNPKATKCIRTGKNTGVVEMDDGGHAEFTCNSWPSGLSSKGRGSPPPHKKKSLVVPSFIKKKGASKPGKTSYVFRHGELVEAESAHK